MSAPEQTTFAALLASPNPSFGEAEVAALLAREWGMDASVRELGSTQDQNFRVAADGRSYVLKIANRATDRVDVEVGDEAMRVLAEAAPGFEVPAVVPTLSGPALTTIDGHLARLVTWVDGVPLADAGHLGVPALRRLGELAGRCQVGLAPMAHPGLSRALQWEPRQAPALVDELLGSVAEGGRREMARRGIAPLLELIAGGGAADLPPAPVHCDVTDYNVVGVVGEDGDVVPTGLVDFGDVVESWRVTEAAHAALSAVFHDLGDPLGGVAEVLAGFAQVAPLTAAEAEAVWPLILARGVVCALSSTHQAGLAGASPHLARLMVEDWAVLEAVLAVPVPLAVATARTGFGFEAHPRAASARAAIADLEPALDLDRPLVPLDLSVGSEALAFGAWESADGVIAVLPDEGTGVGRWGEVRLTAAGPAARRPPAPLHLGLDLFQPAGTPVRLRLAGEAIGVEGRAIELGVTVGSEPLVLRLAGLDPAIAPGDRVDPGALLGTVATAGPLPPHLHLQLALDPGMPGTALTHHRAVALELCPDPSPLIGIDAAAPAPVEAASTRRRRAVAVAAAQPLYYEEPMEVVRGWRHTLYDGDGRPYVDAINNVALVGHSHPAVAAAAERQLRLLNTNSRFLYESMPAYAERLLDLVPDELDRVLFVNSGSEAVDLALRLARAYTGRRDLLAVEGAYHGWTAGPFEVCTNPGDRPDWRRELSPHVHVVDQPNPYRGPHGSAAEPYVDSVRAACAAAGANGGPAAFVVEPLLGNQGGVEPPAGYLADAFQVVRAAGGVCIADEIQVGLGRTGPQIWAFEHERVVPDIVCIAKGAGNGYPLGAVICRKEIAAALDEGTFFSSPAGSPLSCAVGVAVLDALRDEDLPSNAARVGDMLRRGVEELSQQHDAIGAVHGRGLYLGVDLVEDRETKSPATALAGRICERMRHYGVIIQPTGDDANVLKLKPPLCLDSAAVATLVEALSLALDEST
ncbi:MAG: aminotransferase [Actinobacteria bacterium]|nr:aminotransferase [Actinomycetota bacterium]